MDQNSGRTAWNITGNWKTFFWMVPIILTDYDWITVDFPIMNVFITIQVIFFPVLAIIALPVNMVTIFFLSRRKCGLSRVVTCYLVAMALADLLVLILDLILSKFPLTYMPIGAFFRSMIKGCNIHAALIYTVTDCSVWFTVTFTIDRFVGICCQKLKTKYCTGKTAAVVLGTVSAIGFLKNIYWYFSLSGYYTWIAVPFICRVRVHYLNLFIVTQIELFYYILTPVFPFVLVLLTNGFTARHISVTSRARRRLSFPGNGQSARDPEMEKRRKSLVLLLILSGNFILLWAPFTVYSAWNRLYAFATYVRPPDSLRELGAILQLLSCCTNTALYTVTQTNFREQLKTVVKSPLSLMFVKNS
ncbi:probable G-protein coupled receptor 139 [Mobula birostris]|uniref:probable G-protein coupled receptor 139 n=1 Tax=Mobula birostris TaxID=1983395 RepID=UPI003B27BAB3